MIISSIERAEMQKRHVKEALLLLLAAAVIVYAQTVNNLFCFDLEYSIYTDSVNLYPLPGVIDSALFHEDPLANQLVRWIKGFSPGGVCFLPYGVLLHFFSMPVAIKLVSAALAIFSICMVYRWARKEMPFEFAAFFAGIFLVYTLTTDAFFGGMCRSFGALIFFAFIYCLGREKWLQAMLCILCGAWCYISIVPGMVLALLLMLPSGTGKLWKEASWRWGILLCSVAIILTGFMWLKSGVVQQVVVNLKEVQTYKQFQVIENPIQLAQTGDILLRYVFNVFEHSVLYRWFTALLLGLTAIVMIFVPGWWRLPKLIWRVMLAALAAFALLFPFHPTSASRQFIWAIPFFTISILVFSLHKCWPNQKMLLKTLLAGLLLVFVCAHPVLNDVRSWRSNKPIYDYIAALPKDTVVAGSHKSRIVRSVPFFTRRACYYSEKMRDLWLMFYNANQIRGRRQKIVEVMYTDSLETIKKFIAENHIGCFIVESRYYDKESNGELFVPSNRDEVRVNPYIRRKLTQQNSILPKIAAESFDFAIKQQGNTIYIIAAEKILNRG